jgi:ABC-type transporter Mla subunit MlaD
VVQQVYKPQLAATNHVTLPPLGKARDMADDYTQEPALEDAIRQAQTKLEDRLAALRKMGATIAPGDSRFEPEELPAADLRPTGPPLASSMDAPAWELGGTGWESGDHDHAESGTGVAAAASESEVEWLDTGVDDASSGFAWTPDTPTQSWGTQRRTDRTIPAWPGSDEVSSVELLERMQETLPQQFASLELTVQRAMESSASSVSESVHDDMEQVSTRVDFAVERFGELLTTSQDHLTQVVVTVHDQVKQVGGQIGHAVERVAERVSETQNQLEDVVESAGAGVRDRLSRQMDRLEERVTAALEQQQLAIETEVGKVAATVHDELREPLQALQQIQEEMPARFAEVERSQETFTDSLHAALAPVSQQVSHVTEQVDHVTGQAAHVADQVTRVIEHVGQVSEQVGQVSEHVNHVAEHVGEVAEHVNEAAELGIHSTIIGSAKKLDEALGQMSQVAATLEADKVQRAEDLEMLVDAMGSGWKGIQESVETLLGKVSSFEARMTRLEQLIEQLDGIESTVASALEAMQAHPVVVTVSHPLGPVSTTPSVPSADADAGVHASAAN